MLDGRVESLRQVAALQAFPNSYFGGGGDVFYKCIICGKWIQAGDPHEESMIYHKRTQWYPEVLAAFKDPAWQPAKHPEHGGMPAPPLNADGNPPENWGRYKSVEEARAAFVKAGIPSGETRQHQLELLGDVSMAIASGAEGAAGDVPMSIASGAEGAASTDMLTDSMGTTRGPSAAAAADDIEMEQLARSRPPAPKIPLDCGKAVSIAVKRLEGALWHG